MAAKRKSSQSRNRGKPDFIVIVYSRDDPKHPTLFIHVGTGIPPGDNAAKVNQADRRNSQLHIRFYAHNPDMLNDRDLWTVFLWVNNKRENGYFDIKRFN